MVSKKEEALVLLGELRVLAEDLRKSADITDRVIQSIMSKIDGTSTDESDLDEFMADTYIQCMGSKNARRYVDFTEREYAIWHKLLVLAGTVELWERNARG